MRRYLQHFRARYAVEDGSTIPFYVAFLVSLMIVLVIAVDLSSAMLLHESRNNDLAEIRDLIESDTLAIQIKNADANVNTGPGALIANQVRTSMRNRGFNGEIKVYFYEVSKDELISTKRDSRRVYGWQVILSEDYNLPIGSGYGISPIKIQATIASTGMPYSGGKTYRPQQDISEGVHPNYNGLYTFDAGSDTFSFSQNLTERTDEFWPQSLETALDKRLDAIEHEHS